MRTSLWACVLGLGLAPCAPASGQAPSASDAAPVYVDDSQAGRDAQREVDLLLSTGRIADAAVRLQAMIEAHGADLVESGPGAYVQASTWAARRLASDRRLLERYRARYEAEAGNALERGQAAGGYEPLEAVARRFPHTEAAQQARLWVAARRLEAGEAEAAWSILDEGQEQTAGDPAAAEHLTALRAVAAAMLGDERGSLAADAGADRTGQASAAVEAAADLLAPVALASPDLAEGGQPVWSRSWRRLLAERSLFESEFEPLTAAAAADRKSPSGVVVAGEHVVVTDGGAVAGIDLRSGALCWVYEPEPVRADVTEGLDAAQARLRARQLQQMRRGASTQSPGGVVIDGDTVYAVVNAEPESPRTGRRQGALAESRLVALDLKTGSLRWMRRASDWGDRLSFGWISGSPVVSSGRVCVAVRRLRGSGFGDTFVAAADAETGAPAWRRHISSVVQRGGWSVSGQAVS
ncbi:MAG: PQQ-binding-like beta-propeller repeat protein, partial [Planctomycetota bacterium]